MEPLYGRVRTHSDVFSDLIFNENSFLYGYISWSIVRRPNFSPCMRMISNHDFYFIVVNRFSSFWTAGDRSYRNHQMKLIIIGSPESKKNQNTIEKNEFYEWKIWKTIMETINENSFICIKINSWLSTIGPRQHPFLSSAHTGQFFQQLALPPIWLDGIKRELRQHFFLPPIPYRSIISTADSFEIKRGSRQHSFLSSAHTGQIWIFFSWNNPPKTTLYGGFLVVFISKDIFIYFPSWIEFWFYSIHSIDGMNKWSILIIYSFIK